MPQEWKTAEVVLIPRGNRGYRPISLISAFAKGFEAIVEERLRTFTEEHGLLSSTQFGFRRRRSMLNAVERVVTKAESVNNVNKSSRTPYLAILLNVKNAFNSLTWTVILDALVEKNAPQYLLMIVSNYL